MTPVHPTGRTGPLFPGGTEGGRSAGAEEECFGMEGGTV